jgi:hypothetical protein
MRQAGRLYDRRDELTREDLMTIDEEDIRASSLFSDEAGESPDEPDKQHAPGNIS